MPQTVREASGGWGGGETGVVLGCLAPRTVYPSTEGLFTMVPVSELYLN